ncbi:porin [Thioalkalicoccus limnaeus]|uniref:Porin n=1 Tax=Thioalkalicoccus limnaeus TaxID=120681 RepID=A0ABV4BJ94_9GAMM
MNKKMLTLAVAAAMAVPAAAIADATLYGRVHMSIDYVDVDRNASWVPGGVPAPGAQPDAVDGQGNLVPGKDFTGWNLNSNSRASRLGVRGSEELGFGLKAIYQIEFSVDIANDGRDSAAWNGNRGTTLSMRNSFAGLAGDWGTLLAGRHDTPLKISTGKLDLFADTLADMNFTVGFDDLRADNAVAYISPNFMGFQFSGMVMPTGGATFNGGRNLDADSLAEAWSVAGIYNNGPFFVSLAYETLDSDQWQGTGQTGAKSFDKWRVGLGLLDWNGFTLTGLYENWANYRGLDKADADLWQIQAGYAFGNNMVKAMYGQSDLDWDRRIYGDVADKSSWAVGFDHNFTKRSKAYVLYTQMDDDVRDADWSGFSLGMVHSF